VASKIVPFCEIRKIRKALSDKFTNGEQTALDFRDTEAIEERN
jgi:hypothetical protein